MNDKLMQAALEYHEHPTPGKLATEVTKPTRTQEDLALAYSPGVAAPVRAIADNPDDVFRYTNKGNLVGVISDGSAVLGLGNTGALASKPVMEGKGVLFKRFANIDVFDIEVNAATAEEFIDTVTRIAPTFGGINLEDIAAPACFEIERILEQRLDIPVFHDDQHGTAVIICAGLLNALEIAGKKLGDAQIVCLGAGAAGISSMRLLLDLGADPDKLLLVDSKGVIHADRPDLNQYKQEFANKTDKRTLEDAMRDADIFIGVSSGGKLSAAMLASMATNPIVFALANPDPEILPEDAKKVRGDVIVATGRSDYPNQVNNVLGFPYIFRGALDVHASHINREMLKAGVAALRDLTHETVPAEVLKAYNLDALAFGPEYIIPKPFDPRLLDTVAPAIARAAVDSGVARRPLPTGYKK
ncbi:MAG: malate dehydrogenase [Thiotrichales bacterium SG8_50]|nr:MAG: malate dehydrogenase [Thiotrichales bacterium SG8_50]